MKKIYIWGAGAQLGHVYDMIEKENCNVKGIVDSDIQKQGSVWNSQIPIIAPEAMEPFDYVIISVQNYSPVEQCCLLMGIPQEKIIAYWKDSDANGIFENRLQRLLKEQYEKKIYEYRLDSAPYEWGLKPTPTILSGEDLLKKICEDRSSLCRFGDGEFEIMRGNNRPWFQNETLELRARLLEVIKSERSDINIAIAQDFKNFDVYTEETADAIREYMAYETRDEILGFLDMNKSYYDAFVSRPYLIYKDKKNAEKIFKLFKQVWQDRTVILVEGEYSRIGINNDLLEECKSVRRILAPSRNAWDKYEQLLSTVKQHAKKDDLICISLGPTATVLAYDLALAGYQALDIGQIDNEYEWYLMGASKRVDIPDKMVAEVTLELPSRSYRKDDTYLSQICAQIK